MSAVHTKKILKQYFDNILRGEKTYEIRLANWQCEQGDTLELIELDDETKQPTGRTMKRRVGTVGRTKELEFWPEEDVQEYGYQIIALVDEESPMALLQKRAQDIRTKYDALNAKDGHTKWDGVDYTAGFVGDVGDLMKLVMAKDGKRRGEDIDAKLRHELGDCLWSLLVIANHYDIDLEAAFHRTMDELESRLAA